MMFKILILQAWYNLSDEALEKQIARDLMFRRFIDLSLSEAVPDHTTIWRFRNLLNTENLLEPLLEQINTHLEQNSIIVSVGSINIIDATVIKARQSRKGRMAITRKTRRPVTMSRSPLMASAKPPTASRCTPIRMDMVLSRR